MKLYINYINFLKKVYNLELQIQRFIIRDFQFLLMISLVILQHNVYIPNVTPLLKTGQGWEKNMYVVCVCVKKYQRLKIDVKLLAESIATPKLFLRPYI